MPNLTEYWPIKTTFKDQNNILSVNENTFYTNAQKSENFDKFSSVLDITLNTDMAGYQDC